MTGVPLDPIDPTTVGPGITAIPIAPTVWDDADDGQHAVTEEGIVYQRRNGLWHMDPWYQGTDRAEIVDVCNDPASWSFGVGWPRAMIESTHGLLTYITLPPKPSND